MNRLAFQNTIYNNHFTLFSRLTVCAKYAMI